MVKGKIILLFSVILLIAIVWVVPVMIRNVAVTEMPVTSESDILIPLETDASGRITPDTLNVRVPELNANGKEPNAGKTVPLLRGEHKLKADGGDTIPKNSPLKEPGPEERPANAEVMQEGGKKNADVVAGQPLPLKKPRIGDAEKKQVPVKPETEHKPEQNTLESVEEKVKGMISYEVDTLMELKKSSTVTARIKRGKEKSRIETYSDGELKVDTVIEVTKLMGISLEEVEGDGNFTITEKFKSETKEIDTTWQTWQWNVLPKKEGKHSLQLLAYAVQRIGEKDMPVKDIPIFEKVITIQCEYVSPVGTFFKSYWQWLTTVFLIPLYLYFRSKIMEGRKNRKATRQVLYYDDD